MEREGNKIKVIGTIPFLGQMLQKFPAVIYVLAIGKSLTAGFDIIGAFVHSLGLVNLLEIFLSKCGRWFATVD